MDVAENTGKAHGKSASLRWDTSTQFAVTVAVALLIAIALHIKFNASAGVRVGK